MEISTRIFSCRDQLLQTEGAALRTRLGLQSRMQRNEKTNIGPDASEPKVLCPLAHLEATSRSRNAQRLPEKRYDSTVPNRWHSFCGSSLSCVSEDPLFKHRGDSCPHTTNRMNAAAPEGRPGGGFKR